MRFPQSRQRIGETESWSRGHQAGSGGIRATPHGNSNISPNVPDYPPHIVGDPPLIPAYRDRKLSEFAPAPDRRSRILFACLDLDPEESRHNPFCGRFPLPSGSDRPEALIRLTESFNEFRSSSPLSVRSPRRGSMSGSCARPARPNGPKRGRSANQPSYHVFRDKTPALGRTRWPRAVVLPVQPPTHRTSPKIFAIFLIM